MKKAVIFAFCILLFGFLHSLGTLRVKSIKELPPTEMNISVYDADGKWAPVLLVKTELRGLGFTNVSRPTKHAAIYEEGDHRYKFYMNDSQRVVKLTHADYEPLEVRFLADYKINVKTQRVYELVLSNEPEKEIVPVNIRIQPQGALVKLDGKLIDYTKSISITTEEHLIEISLDNYQTLQEEIVVSRENTLFEYKLKELESVIIQISSVPAGALVFIDDDRLGITPLSKNYLQGTYIVRIEKKEYETMIDTINIQPPSFHKNYNLTPNIGSFIVTSGDPKGLEIYVNGKNTFNRTPHTFEKQEPGQYVISAKSGMYETDTKTINLEKGDQASVILNPEPIYATLTINTDKQAVVTLNDSIITQRENIKLAPSVYTISVKLPKADMIEKTIILKRKQNETLDLYPQKHTGSIQIAVSPFDAKVELTGDAGEYYNVNGSKRFEKIPVGQYRIDVSRSEFIPESKTVFLKNNAVIQEEFNLKSFDKEMLRLAYKYKQHKNYSLMTSAAFLAFGLISNFVADGYYDDYQNADTNATAVSNRDNYEKWDSYRNYSYSISIVPIIYTTYSWIKQSHYNKLARTKR